MIRPVAIKVVYDQTQAHSKPFRIRLKCARNCPVISSAKFQMCARNGLMRTISSAQLSLGGLYLKRFACFLMALFPTLLTSFVRFVKPVDFFNLVNVFYSWAQSSVYTKELFVHNGGEGEVIE